MDRIICTVCGSEDVEVKAFVKPNLDNHCSTTDFTSYLDNIDNCFCVECGDNTILKYESEIDDDNENGADDIFIALMQKHLNSIRNQLDLHNEISMMFWERQLTGEIIDMEHIINLYHILEFNFAAWYNRLNIEDRDSVRLFYEKNREKLSKYE